MNYTRARCNAALCISHGQTPCVWIHFGEHRLEVHVQRNIRSRHKSKAWNDDLITRLQTEGEERHVNRGGPIGCAQGVAGTRNACEVGFEALNERPA
jgi:hypothetical protein